MFRYYIRMAFRNLASSPIMTLLMVMGLAVGAGTSAATQTVVDSLSPNPIPSRQGQLFHVKLASQALKNTHIRNNVGEDLLDLDTTLQLLQASHFPISPIALSDVSLPPMGQERYPHRANALITTSEAFNVFNIKLRVGHLWSKDADTTPTFQVVISESLARRMFGGSNPIRTHHQRCSSQLIGYRHCQRLVSPAPLLRL